MRIPLQITLVVLLAAGAADAQDQNRFRGMDSNNDGTITRAEWRGNDRAFRNQDWNRDGIVDRQDEQIAERFRGYDMNNDRRVATSEWPGDPRLFTRLDSNRDQYLTLEEYTTGAGFRLDAQGGPQRGFSNLDTNRDGAITRNEWNLSRADFARLDVNRDNRITRFEFENDPAGGDNPSYSSAQFTELDANRDGWITRSESRMANSEFSRFDANSDNRISRFEFENVASGTVDNPSAEFDRFATVDLNRDGWLARSEWRGSEAGFTRLDTNGDNRLSRAEYDAELPTTQGSNSSETSRRSAAWRAGHERGTKEGEAAGREDFVRNHGWDLDGQCELERADSGYTAQVGSLSDYQAGYREGFRRAYRSGFMSARDNR